MRAQYDSKADVLGIELVPGSTADASDVFGNHVVIALDRDRPVHVEILHPAEGLGPLEEAARRHGLDAEAIAAATQAALEAPDREVIVQIAARSSK